MNYLWQGEKNKSTMTPRVDSKQLELLLAEVKKKARERTFVYLFMESH